MAKLASFTLDTGNELVAAAPLGRSLDERLPLSKIRTDGGTQPRAGVDPTVAAEYAEALRDGARFPAVDVMFDGTNYWLFDGFHRVDAHQLAGLTEIAVKVHQGTLADAQWRSFAANRTHGLRRTNADKERAVRSALQHTNSATLSDRQIAQHVGVDHKTVGRYRRELATTGEIPQSTQRTGVDGRTIDTAKISQANRERPKPMNASSVAVSLDRVVGKCGVCGRALTDPNSVGKACGPECSKKLAARDGEPQEEQPEPFAEEMRGVHGARFVPAVEPETPVIDADLATCKHRGQIFIQSTISSSVGTRRKSHVLLCEDCGQFQAWVSDHVVVEFRLDSEMAVKAAGRGLEMS